MIQRVLVANRGEIACRILRACREAGLSSVAIYAENDREGMFRELADESVLLEGDTMPRRISTVQPSSKRPKRQAQMLFTQVLDFFQSVQNSPKPSWMLD